MSDMPTAEPMPDPQPQPGIPDEPKAAEGVLKGDKGLDVAQVWISGFLIVVAGCAAFANVFGVPFHGLDLALFTGVPEVRSVFTAAEAYEAFPAAPLTLLSYGLNWSLTPAKAGEFHLFGLLFHLMNGVLLYLVARRLIRPALPEPVAMLAGLLFVVHPLTSESLAYVVGRPGILGTFFGLLSLLFFLKATTGEFPRHGLLAVSLAAYAAAVASSFSFLLLPLAILSAEAVQGGIRKRWRIHSLYWALFLALAVAILAPGDNAAFPPEEGASYIARLSHIPGGLLSFFVAPVRLSAVQDSLLAAVTSIPGLLSLAVLLAGTIAMLWLRWSAGVGLAWASALVVGAALLIPASTAGAERALYAPLAGLCILLPWLFSLLSEASYRKVLGGVAAALILGMLWLTFLRVALWQDPISFWTRTSEEHPDAVEPFQFLAQYANAQLAQATPETATEITAEWTALAAENWRRVLDLKPEDPHALAGLGKALFVQDNEAEAVPLLKQALRGNPKDQQAALYIAFSAESRVAQEGVDRRAMLREAVEYYGYAQAMAPLAPEILGRYGMARLQLGDIGGSAQPLAIAAQALPESPYAGALNQVGRVVERLQQLEQQIQQLAQQDNRSPRIGLLRAEQQLLQGDIMTAFYLLERAYRRQPSSIEAWAMLGAVRARMGGADAFLVELGQAFPQDPAAWKQLVQRTAAAMQWDAALKYVQHQQQLTGETAPPKIILGDVALELQQMATAQQLFAQASEESPDNPLPWLKLADIAIAAKNAQETQRLLGEAQRRGAAAEEVKRRADAMGVTPQVPTGPQRTVIR